MNVNDPVEARRELIAAAAQLREVLSTLNRYGDAVDRRLATQCDGAAYGEVHDGLTILLDTLFPSRGVENRSTAILGAMLEMDIGVEAAANHVASNAAPMAEYSTDEVREELARCRVYLAALDDGMLRVDKLIGSGSETEARAYLTDAADACLAALAYRGEPETKEVPGA